MKLFATRQVACCFAVIMLVAVFVMPAGAQVPKKINYQGMLTTGTPPVPVTGTQTMIFSLYDVASGGAALWTETRSVTLDSAGRYSVDLGAVNPINLAQAKPYWLGVKVGTDPEMTPRKELTSAMYALFLDGITVKNGSVGIGTMTPNSKLDVTTTGENGIRLNTTNTSFAVYEDVNSPSWIRFRPYKGLGFMFSNNGDTPSVVISESGNVGIGTVKPRKNLSIQAGTPTILLVNKDTGHGVNFEYREDVEQLRINYNKQYGDEHRYTWMVYDVATANVGIGTTKPTHKLSVNGTIRAKEIIVDNNADWPDFVFDKDHQLMPLSAVEQHIAAEKHLPGIPSAQEVEQNGVSLGDMQAKQLQKIEELTLYMLEMDKKVTALQQENESLKAKVSTLEQAAGK